MTTSLDEINAALLVPDRLVGLYRVVFSGLIPSANSFNLIGQVRAYPTAKVDAYGPEGPRYFISVLRTLTRGRYEPGSTWDLRPISGRRHFMIPDFDTVGGLNQARREIEEAFGEVCTMVQRDAAGETIPLLPSVELIPIDPETGEVVSDQYPGDRHRRIRAIFREQADGSCRLVKQTLRWVDDPTDGLS
jgi:hypothetical protein